MEYYTISQLSNEFDISTRTIRYYEERGLISPKKTPSGVRKYTKKDRTRLKLIMRGKRLGFTIEEIKEMLELFDKDRTGRSQLERTIEYCRKKEEAVKLKIAELEEIRREIHDVLMDFEKRLEEYNQKKQNKTKNE